MGKRSKKAESEEPLAPPSQEPKRKVGRPSSYDPSMCQKLLEFGAEGYAVVEMAVGLNVTKQTLYQWAKDASKPEFADALIRARELSEAYHAEVYRKGCKLPANMFNAAGYAKYMGIVFADWREITRSEITGKDGGAIEVEAPSDRDVAQRAAFLLQRGLKPETKPH